MRGQQAFLDVRVFDPNANRISTKQSLNATSKMKNKPQCSERVLEIDHGSFTPFVFSFCGAMGRECSTFYNRLAKKIVEKLELHQSSQIGYQQKYIS